MLFLLSLLLLLPIATTQLSIVNTTYTLPTSDNNISSILESPSNTPTAQLPPLPTLPPIFQPQNISARIENQYIILLKKETSQTDKLSLIQQLQNLNGFYLLHTYSSAVNGFTFNISSSLVNQALSTLQNSPLVTLIEQDSLRELFIDTQQNAIWNLDRVDQRSNSLDNMYHYNNSAQNVNIYVIDTGIRQTHSQFEGRAKMGYDAVTSGGDATDCHGHGTHVAGTIGSTTYGLAKSTTLYAVRVLDCSGSGSNSAVIQGVDWVQLNAVKPAVAVMSLGGSASPSLDSAVSNAIASGIVFSIAAGNSNADACNTSPARVETAITVGATDENDGRASFSNWGSCVSIFAPGVDILSLGIDSDTATKTLSGTSMAAPHLAGASALYLSLHPSGTPQDVKDSLLCAATKDAVSDAQNSNNALLFTFAAPSVQKSASTEACASDCQQQSGTINSSNVQMVPSNGYNVTGIAGTHRSWLTSQASGTLNALTGAQAITYLYLYKLINNSWISVAASTAQSSSQSISYNDPIGGIFAYGIQTAGPIPDQWSLTYKLPSAPLQSTNQTRAATCKADNKAKVDYNNPFNPNPIEGSGDVKIQVMAAMILAILSSVLL